MQPSDNFGACQPQPGKAGMSAEDFMLELAASDKVQCRFTVAASVVPKGFNHSTRLVDWEDRISVPQGS